MDKYIDSHFERLEKALTSLIDSVAKYHPSAAQGRELDAADRELSRGLEEVQTHQNNYQRIQQLRAESLSLDGQIRDTLSSLATTRKDILTTQATVFPDGPNYAFTYEELLGFARRISKTSMPPPGISNGIAIGDSFMTDANMNGQQGGSTTQTPSATQPPTPNFSQMPSEIPSQQTVTSTNTTLPEGLTMHLNPLSSAIFFPWPLEDKIRGGSLVLNQQLADEGIEPKGYDPVEEEERRRREDDEKKEREEKERQEREEQERKMREERERIRVERERQREKEQRENWRRASVITGATGAPPGAPRSSTAGPGDNKQFQFTNIEDMGDDED